MFPIPVFEARSCKILVLISRPFPGRFAVYGLRSSGSLSAGVGPIVLNNNMNCRFQVEKAYYLPEFWLCFDCLLIVSVGQSFWFCWCCFIGRSLAIGLNGWVDYPLYPLSSLLLYTMTGSIISGPTLNKKTAQSKRSKYAHKMTVFCRQSISSNMKLFSHSISYTIRQSGNTPVNSPYPMLLSVIE